jgi:DNA-damage-inducible protein J
MATNPDAYDTWFRSKVQEALADTRPAVPHRQVMVEAQARIDRKRRDRKGAWPLE